MLVLCMHLIADLTHSHHMQPSQHADLRADRPITCRYLPTLSAAAKVASICWKGGSGARDP